MSDRPDLEQLRLRVRALLEERRLPWDEVGVAEVHPGGPVNISVRLNRPGAALDIDVTAPTAHEAVAELVKHLSQVPPEGRWGSHHA